MLNDIEATISLALAANPEPPRGRAIVAALKDAGYVIVPKDATDTTQARREAAEWMREQAANYADDAGYGKWLGKQIRALPLEPEKDDG